MVVWFHEAQARRERFQAFLPQAIEHLRIDRDENEMVEHLEYKGVHLPTNSWLLYCFCGIIASAVSTTSCAARIAVLSFVVLPGLSNNGFIFSAGFEESLYSSP